MFNVKIPTQTNQSAGDYIHKHVFMIFALIVLLLLVMEGFVVKISVGTILGFDSAVIAPTFSPTTQINFVNYDAAIKKVQQGAVYLATSTPIVNPFVPPAAEVKK